MKRHTTNPFLLAVRDKYFDALGMGHLTKSSKRRWMKNRKRAHVEERNAMLNAVSPFVSRVDAASVFNKDHATVLHAVKNHEMYMKYSAHYGRCYEKAMRIVAETSKEMNVYPIGQYRHYISSTDEIDVLQRTLDNLQNLINDVKHRVQKDKHPLREYREFLDREEQ